MYIKFLIILYTGRTLKIEETLYTIIKDKIPCSNMREVKRKLKKIKHQHDRKNIVIKEHTKNGWIPIKVKF